MGSLHVDSAMIRHEKFMFTSVLQLSQRGTANGMGTVL